MEPRTTELPVLEGERVRLRLLRPDDAGAILAYYRANFEHLRRAMPRPSEHFLTEDHWRTQALLCEEELRTMKSVRLIVLPMGSGAVAGTVNFTQIQRGPSWACVLGYGIARELEGRGLMSESLRLGIGYVFRELNLHRICANYRPANERSARLLRKLGFVVEGYARDLLLLDGAWEDHVLTSLLNPEWRAP